MTQSKKHFINKHLEGGKYFYDEKTADLVIDFIEKHIKHTKGPKSGEPFILEQWQKEDIICPLFGVKSVATGLRRYKFGYFEIPKKNGKSPLLSAIVLITLIFEKDEGAEIYSAASTRDQAKIVFGDACKMAKKDDYINSKVNVMQHAIIYGNKSYKALSADIGANDGINANLVVFDELHRQPNRALYDVLIGSMAAKEQPMFIMITTAGNDFNSICYEQHEYAMDVKNGIIKDETYLSVIYAADIKDDPFIESTWKKANPNYGISVRKDFIAEQAQKAKTNKAYLNTFLRLHLNIWTNVKDVWIPDDFWQSCGADLDITQLIGEVCYGGLDLSSTSDLTAFSLVFPPSMRDYYPDNYILFNWSWLPQEKGKDSADKNNNNYKNWLDSGWIEETSGNVIDYDYIQERIMEICESYNIATIAYDPYNSVQIASKLEENGINMFKHRQGDITMNFPVTQFEVKVGRKELLHNNNPVMRWQVSNGVLVSNTAGNLVKVGKNAPHQKIDNLISSIMALGLSIVPEIEKSSYLENNEPIFIEL